MQKPKNVCFQDINKPTQCFRLHHSKASGGRTLLESVWDIEKYKETESKSITDSDVVLAVEDEEQRGPFMWLLSQKER